MKITYKSLEQGERPTKYFFNKIKTKYANSTISSLEINNQIVTDTALIEQHVYEHFRNQFDSDSPFTPNLNLDQFLQTHNCKLPTISETNYNNISQPISNHQIKEAIHKLNSKSSSGPDGYSPKLIKCLYKIIPNFFHVAVKKELGEIGFEHTYSPNVKQRKIILIPKSNTSHKSIKSLRPISLLSSFYKIISNILAAQLKGALLDDNIMPKHMLAYLPRRSGQEAVRLLLDSIDNARIRNADLFLLQADLESAFDSLSKPYFL